MTEAIPRIMFDTNKSFNPNTDLIIDNRVFRNVKIQNVNEYDEWDKTHKKIMYLHGKDADYVTWQENGRLYCSEKSYHNAKKKIIGGRQFDKVLSNKMFIDGTRVYENRMFDGGIQKITVSAEGDIVNIKSYPKVNPGFFQRLSEGIFKVGAGITSRLKK